MPGGATITHTANSITVTASSGAGTGDVHVSYHVQDATKDPNRTSQTSGQLTATIHDVPGQPTQVAAKTAGSGKATVSWKAAQANGKTIEHYQVTHDGGKSYTTVAGTATSATISGLTNGTAYRFQVRAENADGAGALSAQSGSVTSYAKPTTPSGLSIKNNSGYAKSTFTLSWHALSGVTETGGGSITYHSSFNGGAYKTTTGTSATTASVGAGTYSF